MKRIACLVSLVLLVAACGSDATGDGEVPASTTTPGAVTTAAPVSSGGGIDVAGSADEVCARLFTLDEVAALFGEPATLDDILDVYNESLGQILCSWSTVEDPADTEDLAVESLVVQVYTSDPIPASNFYAPDGAYEDVRHIEGIGEDAFVAESLGLATGFIDGPVAGFVAYSVFDLSGGEPQGAGEERVIEYLRMLHDRVA